MTGGSPPKLMKLAHMSDHILKIEKKKELGLGVPPSAQNLIPMGKKENTYHLDKKHHPFFRNINNSWILLGNVGCISRVIILIPS